MSMTLPGFGDESLGGQFQAGKRVDILTNLNGVLDRARTTYLLRASRSAT